MGSSALPHDEEKLRATLPPALFRRMAGGLIFGFVILLLLMLFGDIRQVGQQVFNFHWGLYPIVLALTFFNYTLRCFKWHYYLKQVGVRSYPLWRSARLFVAGFPLAVTPGKVGEALKAVWLNRETGAPIATGIAVVLAERISDGLAVLALSTFGVIAYPQFWPAFAAILILLLAIVIASQIRPLALWGISQSARLPVIGRVSPRLLEFYEGSFAVFRPKASLTAVALGTVSWLGEGIGFYLILLGLGMSPSRELASMAIFILAFSTVVGAASTLPGGLGAAEASIAGMLMMLLTLPVEISAAATLLIRFATLWFGVSLGMVVWLFSPDLLGLVKNASTTEQSNTPNH
ncbi:MAG: lysylphosphatidylglycerol synthase transmembrane domain-containing protein [Anaerolineales bacterium]|nr:lysylphosphatidylglycerol synthase transmembrane domain-containing protein [Anaerolineales bacterium]